MDDITNFRNEVIYKNRCWNCKSELQPKDGMTFTYYCSNVDKCSGMYYSCVLCEGENNNSPLSIDHDSILSGQGCMYCEKYYCSSHWQCVKSTDYFDSSCIPCHEMFKERVTKTRAREKEILQHECDKNPEYQKWLDNFFKK